MDSSIIYNSVKDVMELVEHVFNKLINVQAAMKY